MPGNPLDNLRALVSAVYGIGGGPVASMLDALRLPAPAVRRDFYRDEGIEEAVDTHSLDELDQWELLRRAKADAPGDKLLDFGCGVGGPNRTTIESMGYHWRGLDINNSRDEAVRRETLATADRDSVTLYNGRKIPLKRRSFDVVFSNQSLGHVESADTTIAEIARILRPRGLFIGSVSHLEPYHGFSTLNFTPFGLNQIAQRHGLRCELLVPGIDAFSLIARVLLWKLGQERCGDQVFTLHYAKSPLNVFLDTMGREQGLSFRDINIWKLNLCAQFRFRFRKVN